MEVRLDHSSLGARSDMIRSIFGKAGDRTKHQECYNNQQLEQYKPFFDFYDRNLRQVNDIFVGQRTQRDEVKLFLSDHSTACALIEQLRQLPASCDKAQICEALRPYLGFAIADAVVDQIVEILVRCLLRVNIRTRGGWNRGLRFVEWHREESVVNLLTKSLPPIRSAANGTIRRIDPHFTAAYMARVRGLRLETTDYLEDHLVIHVANNGRRTLLIFHNKDWLKKHKAAAELMHESYPNAGIHLPVDTVDETIMSLSLLFPRYDKATEKLCEKNSWLFYVDPPYQKARDFSEFSIWKDRLVELYEDVFNAPPYDLKSLWMDTRNLERWSAVWFALALGVISTVAGVVQAVYAVLGYYKQ